MNSLINTFYEIFSWSAKKSCGFWHAANKKGYYLSIALPISLSGLGENGKI